MNNRKKWHWFSKILLNQCLYRIKGGQPFELICWYERHYGSFGLFSKVRITPTTRAVTTSAGVSRPTM
jgi:hypothetical protein